MVDRAGVVVGQPLPVVEAMVRDVSGWAALFGAVEDVSRLGHDRYLVELHRGRRRTRAALVRVQWNAAEHRFVWHTLNGPDWSGELWLTALTGRRTSVRLSFGGPLGHCGDPVPAPADGVCGSGPQAQRPTWRAGWRRLRFRRPGPGQARRDLQTLSRRVAALPQPVRPARLTPLPGARPVEDLLAMTTVRQTRALRDLPPVPRSPG